MPKVAVYTRATTGGSRRRYVKAARGSTGPFFLRYEINGKRVWEGLGTRTYTFALADARSKESSLLCQRILSGMAAERAKERRKLVLRPVGVEKVRDRNAFSAAMIAAAEFFVLPSAKRRLPQRVLSIG